MVGFSEENARYSVFPYVAIDLNLKDKQPPTVTMEFHRKRANHPLAVQATDELVCDR